MNKKIEALLKKLTIVIQYSFEEKLWISEIGMFRGYGSTPEEALKCILFVVRGKEEPK